jgi:dienelactone hydrolase
MADPAKLFFRNPYYDGQLARTLGASYVHGADIGEAMAAARRVGRPTGEHWLRAWTIAGDTAFEIGRRGQDDGDPVGATHAYLRASEYYRQAYFFIRSDLDDPRLQATYAKHVDAFHTALGVMDRPALPVRIPYQDTTIQGYLFTPAGPATARPTLVFPAGYDSTAEAGWSNVAGAMRRGYASFTFEGPGQGEALYTQRLYLRPDFEAVMTPVLDWLVARPEVDAGRIGVIGRSFAGYLAPRAAAHDHRIGALVCDPAQPDMAAHLPGGPVGKVLVPAATLQARLSAGRAEFFGARMAAHGLHRIADYFDELRRYTMLDDAGKISCPTLIVDAENDFAGGSAAAFQAALTCPNTLVRLTAAGGADGHCGGLGQEVWNDAVYGWLARTFASAR